MKKHIKLIIALALTTCLCTTLFAADGTRNTTTPGNWSDGGSWVGGIIPGAGDTANFTNDTTVIIDTIIDVDTTVKNINVNDGDGTTNNNDLENGAGKLTLAGGSTIDCATRLNLKCNVAGTEGFTSTGAGLLNLGATANDISGTVNLNGAGGVLINHKDALQNADVNVATLVNSRKNEFNAKSITVANGGQLNMFQVDVPADPGTIIADSVTVQNGGKLGNGFDAANPTIGVPIKFVSPSVTVESGGEILVKTTMASGGSTALPGISGSNIVVNNGGGINFGGANGVANATFTISNPLTLEGYGATANLGALTTYANGLNLTNDSEITVTGAGTTRIGQWGVGGYMIMNKPITGTGNLEFLGQAAHWTHYKTYEFYATNTYSGNTKLISFAASTTYNVHQDQVFPNQALNLEVGNWNPECWLVYDLNGHNQQVGYTEMNGPGTKTLKSTGGNGTLTIDVGAAYGLVMNNGGKLILGGGNVSTPSYVVVRDNCELIVTAGTFYCGLEILNGHAGITGTVTVSDSGVIENFVFRNGDTDEPSSVNLNEGGVLKIAAMHAVGAVADASYLNFNGGTLSDGTWPDWNGSYTNWIQVITNLIVKAGGAKIEVNNVNGRVITKSLMHDASLGGTADGGLTKLGAETLTLSAVNTYTGPTVVQNGTLVVNGSIAASSGITVASGAKIGGSGSVGALTVPNGGTVSPGTSIGTLSSGDVTMETGSEYDWEVGDPVSADLLDVTGTFSIPSGGMTVNAIKAGAPNGTYTLVQTTGGIIGDVNNITMNYTGGLSGSVHPVIVGNNLEVDVIPEPFALGLIAIFGLAFLRRK